jgi:hypothetical protein
MALVLVGIPQASEGRILPERTGASRLTDPEDARSYNFPLDTYPTGLRERGSH